MNRRTFLKTTAATTAFAATGASVIAALQNYGAKRIPIALQLYTVGADLRRDMGGTLAQIAKLGYKGVEFAGFNNVEAKDIKKMLDDNGLKAVGCHTALNTLQG